MCVKYINDCHCPILMEVFDFGPKSFSNMYNPTLRLWDEIISRVQPCYRSQDLTNNQWYDMVISQSDKHAILMLSCFTILSLHNNLIFGVLCCVFYVPALVLDKPLFMRFCGVVVTFSEVI